MKDPDVIVVGAGPAGMVLSLLLARSGVAVTVLEQGRTFEREFRGEVLQPGSVRVFDDIGLGERVMALSGGAPAGVTIARGAKLLTVEFTTPGPNSARFGVVPQPELLELLATEGGKRPEFSLLMGWTFKELRREGERVAGVRATRGGTDHIELQAPLVVACDGRVSSVRRGAGISLIDYPVPFDLLWFSTPLPPGMPNRAHVRVKHNELFAAFESRRNRVQVGWLIHKGEYARLRARPFADVVRHITEHVPELLHDFVQQTLGGWSDLALLPVVSQMASRWQQPGLLLLGDAAHPMSPAGGQGINVAIYDAVLAARALAPALKCGTSRPAVARVRGRTPARDRASSSTAEFRQQTNVHVGSERRADVCRRTYPLLSTHATPTEIHARSSSPLLVGGSRSASRLRPLATSGAYGFCMIMRWAYGVPDHMTQVPVVLYFEESPEVLGSSGHMSIQCGG